MTPEETADCGVSISRTHGNGAEVRLQIEDARSGASIRVSMTLEQFAIALFGLSCTPANLDRAYKLERWGQTRLLEHRSVSSRDRPYDEADKAEWCKRMQAENCPEGYEFSHGGFTNQQTYNMTFARWE